MEEKKLTDEEIVKALECCAIGRKCRECPYVIKKIDCFLWQRVESDLLDLIHRLQDDYAKLKERYVKVLDLNEKVIAEQKAEIERLKEEKTKEVFGLLDQYEKAEADVHSMEREADGYRQTIAELQKQLDELKKENNDLLHERQMAFMDGHQQAVKDTAKEALEAFICKLVNSRLVSTKEDLYVEMLETKDDLLKECYGVEVE